MRRQREKDDEKTKLRVSGDDMQRNADECTWLPMKSIQSIYFNMNAFECRWSQINAEYFRSIK